MHAELEAVLALTPPTLPAGLPATDCDLFLAQVLILTLSRPSRGCCVFLTSQIYHRMLSGGGSACAWRRRPTGP